MVKGSIWTIVKGEVAVDLGSCFLGCLCTQTKYNLMPMCVGWMSLQIFLWSSNYLFPTFLTFRNSGVAILLYAFTLFCKYKTRDISYFLCYFYYRKSIKRMRKCNNLMWFKLIDCYCFPFQLHCTAPYIDTHLTSYFGSFLINLFIFCHFSRYNELACKL